MSKSTIVVILLIAIAAVSWVFVWYQSSLHEAALERREAEAAQQQVAVEEETRQQQQNPNQQAQQMDAFAEAILEDRESIIPGEMGRRDIAIIMAIYEAARTGKPVELAG